MHKTSQNLHFEAVNQTCLQRQDSDLKPAQKSNQTPIDLIKNQAPISIATEDKKRPSHDGTGEIHSCKTQESSVLPHQ